MTVLETGGGRDIPDPQRLLDLAVDLAGQAAALLRQRPADLDVSAKSTPTDAVTVMDRRAERLLVEGLLAARPDDGVLGEEGDDEPGRSGVRWVVDPIDGTVNYLYDLPGYAVSVAAQVDGRSVAGVVHDVVHDEVFTAVAGGGATRNGRSIHCTGATELSRSLIGTGFAYDAGHRAKQAQLLTRVLPVVRDIRRAGSAAVDVCSVACGRLDGYYEWGPFEWDVAAAGLVAAEAGAVVRGRADGASTVLAAAPGIADALAALVGLPPH